MKSPFSLIMVACTRLNDGDQEMCICKMAHMDSLIDLTQSVSVMSCFTSSVKCAVIDLTVFFLCQNIANNSCNRSIFTRSIRTLYFLLFFHAHIWFELWLALALCITRNPYNYSKRIVKIRCEKAQISEYMGSCCSPSGRWTHCWKRFLLSKVRLFVCEPLFMINDSMDGSRKLQQLRI